MINHPEVTIVDTTSATFLPDLAAELKRQKVDVMFANTIMRCDVILLSSAERIPTVWVGGSARKNGVGGQQKEPRRCG